MEINFANNRTLMQAVVQDKRTNKILRIGYLNEKAYSLMKHDKQAVLWDKEQEAIMLLVSGEHDRPLKVDSIIPNETKDAVIIKVLPEGSTTGADAFLGEKNIEDLSFLSHLQDFIEKRFREMPEESYTTRLFREGVNKISQKVGEEAVETIIEAVNGSKEQFIYESSDLIYHLLVLLTSKGIRIEDLARELKARHV